MLMELFTLHNKQMEEVIGNEYEDNTLKGYKTTFRHLTSYLMANYKVSDICIDALDYNFIKGFEHHLKTFFVLRRFLQKSISKTLKKLSIITASNLSCLKKILSLSIPIKRKQRKENSCTRCRADHY